MKKYKLIHDDTIIVNGKRLYRIQALKDFGDVRKGELGGYIQKSSNLSHKGCCWVYNNAKVYGNAKVFEDAKILDDARVYDDAKVYGNAKVSGNAEIFCSAKVYGNAKVYGAALIFDYAEIYGNAKVHGEAIVRGNTVVCKDANVYGNAIVENGILTKDIKEDLVQYIACSLNIYPNPITNAYILYKKVNKIKDGVYSSLYDSSFIYRDGEVVSVRDYDPSFVESYASGLHVSTPFHWFDGDTLIAVEVHVDDIITCMDGKIRCKKLKVLGEVKNYKEV